MALSDLTEADLHVGKGGSKYTYEQKVMAVATFFVEQNMKKVSEITGIDYSVIRAWKTRSVWWPKVMQEIQKEHKDQFCSDLYKVVGTALGEVQDRLKHGDERLSVEHEWVETGEVDADGKPVKRKQRVVYRDREKIKGKDAMIIAATAQDKLERFETGGLLEETEGLNERLSRIADTLEKTFREVEGKTIEGEIADAEIIEYGGEEKTEGLGEAAGGEVMEKAEGRDSERDGRSSGE